MANFLPLETPKAWGMLNSHLGNESYISGVQPTSDDVVVFSALKAEPEKKWAHVLRWYKHIASFGAASAKWPAPGGAASASAAAPAEEAKEDDDLDLFGEETEEDKAANEARKKAAEPKKAGPVMKSAVILDVKPWGEETDMATLEAAVRNITVEGLEWKAAKLIEIAFGIKKLQIMCHVVDDLVSVDEDVVAGIEALEDYVQSVDIFAFNKL